jgi:pimeloyl-ACP methyl ester carboxylesterase
MSQDLQRDLTRLSTQSTHVIAARSGHFIQDDEPELVIDAIRKVIQMVRGW